MGGSFYALLSLGDRASMRLEMVRGQRDGDQVLHTVTTDVHTLYRSIDDIAATLIEFCKKQPEEVPDYRELVEAKQRASDAFRDQSER